MTSCCWACSAPRSPQRRRAEQGRRGISAARVCPSVLKVGGVPLQTAPRSLTGTLRVPRAPHPTPWWGQHTQPVSQHLGSGTRVGATNVQQTQRP